MTACGDGLGVLGVGGGRGGHRVDVVGEQAPDVLGEPDEEGEPGAQVGRAGALGQPGPGVDGPVGEAAQPGLGDDVDGRLERLLPGGRRGAGRRRHIAIVSPREAAPAPRRRSGVMGTRWLGRWCSGFYYVDPLHP